MERREFLKRASTWAAGAGAGAAAAGAGLAGCAQEESSAPAVHTQPRVQWRLTSSFPRGLDTIFGSNAVLAERLAALSDGRFTLRVHPAGEIVPGLQVLDAVQQGTVQVGQTASYYFIGKNPALAFDCCVPFGFNARQQTAWLLEGGGRELLQPLFADFNIVSLPAGNTGTQMGGWFQRAVRSVSDLQGLKMRIPGLGGQVMSRLGVTVQVLAGGDIFPALERGAIDATEWVGPYDDEKLGFYKIARFYHYPGWWEPGPSLSYYVNKTAWEGLPAAYRAMFEVAAGEAAQAMQSRYDAKNPAALGRLLQHGVQLQRFPDDVMQAAERATFEILEDEAAKDATYRKVFEAWKQARRQAFQWWGTAELAYGAYSFHAP